MSLEEGLEVETDLPGDKKTIKGLSQRQYFMVPLAQIELGKVKLTYAHEQAMEEKRLRKKSFIYTSKKFMVPLSHHA